MSGQEHTPPFEPGTDDCNQALEVLYHFLQGELTEERRVTIEVHLNGCSSCLEVYDFEAELREVVAERCQEEVPDDLRRRIADLLGLEDQA
ncbi:MAG: mycothiol system anti-sigma-R factor [Acidimicrobiales bacterium]|nr:mycothiol system anti-sigma-R factor [Acidimicrobiales bacterium]